MRPLFLGFKYGIMEEIGGVMRNNEVVGGAERMDPEEKAEILREAMLMNQPNFEDFMGEPGFSRGMLERDERSLDAKRAKMRERKSDEVAGDRYAGDAEPIVAYVLNSERFLQTRDNFAYLASEFDDKMNGVDVVFGVEKKDHSGDMVMAVDVATGTNAKSIKGKFEKHAENDWLTEVKYCTHDGAKWSEPRAPHFVVGMMPANIDRALDKVQITDETIMRETDPKTDFMLTSEIYEQIEMELAGVEGRYNDTEELEQVAKLKDLRAAVRAKLYKICQVKGETKEERAKDFRPKYAKAVREVQGDLVYRNILIETRERRERYDNQRRGNVAMKAV